MWPAWTANASPISDSNQVKSTLFRRLSFAEKQMSRLFTYFSLRNFVHACSSLMLFRKEKYSILSVSARYICALIYIITLKKFVLIPARNFTGKRFKWQRDPGVSGCFSFDLFGTKHIELLADFLCEKLLEPETTVPLNAKTSSLWQVFLTK